jgi:chromosome segregation ATPase
MSKAAKTSIYILILLLAGGLGFAGYTLLEKQKVEQQKASLERELQASQDREKKNLGEMKGLKDQLAQEAGEKSKFTNTITGLEKRVEELLTQVSDISAERDKWQSRIEEIKKERGELLGKVEELTARLQERPQVVYQEKVVYKDREPEPAAPANGLVPDAGGDSTAPEPMATLENASPDDFPNASNTDEKYLAQLLKEKTALEVEIDKLKADLSQRSLEIVDLKQANENTRMDLDAVRQEKETIAGDMKEKEDMINRLSLELARARNDKQFVARKVDQLTQKNSELRQDLKKLAAAKMVLEKSIVQITQEKDGMDRKLEQAEAVLQNKIGEIWEVKDSLDRSFQAVQDKPLAANEVELSPIVVKTQDAAPVAAVFAPAGAPAPKPGFEGKVMSVNEQSNFVIVDIGEKRGLRVGDTLGVYRGPDYIARLEVLQVRPDIAAADLKEQSAQIKVGDLVR